MSMRPRFALIESQGTGEALDVAPEFDHGRCATCDGQIGLTFARGGDNRAEHHSYAVQIKTAPPTGNGFRGVLDWLTDTAAIVDPVRRVCEDCIPAGARVVVMDDVKAMGGVRS